MRICLVAHGLPPVERTGVENYTDALAAALARLGHTILVFVPRRDARLPNGSLRREARGAVEIHWIVQNADPTGPREMLERPGVTREFGRFLERERPEIVHFQHWIKLGVGLVFEARQRGIPTVYTAHDYFPVCHRYTLLRPDLAHCEVRGDSMACARCDLAASFLNARAERLGDYQMGALPEQLTSDERAALADLLEDRPEPAGFSESDVDAACDLRRDLDSMRARAFAAVERILAPTNFLARELVRGGVDRRKIHLQPYGIANGDLLGLPPIRPDPRAPVRFGYLGGLAKQKGVHVLLEGFERARVRAELAVFGGGSDAEYVERLAREAGRIGARWGGPYERKDLPQKLAELDALIVPSIWAENYPIVIREAFSARRPVLASALGAIPESVRDGVDGLLFAPGDPAALARAIEKACAPGALEALAAGIPEVKTIDQEAEELLAHYRALAPPPKAARELPSSLAGFVEEVERVQRLPTRELFARALGGVARLRRELGRDLGTQKEEELLLAALGTGSRAQTLVRDLRRETEWLNDQARALASELGGAAAAAAAERDAKLGEREGQLRSTAELGLLALRSQSRLLSREFWPILADLFRLTHEGAGTPDLPPQGAPPGELSQAFHERIEALESLRRELDWRRELTSGLEAEVQWRRARTEELEAEVHRGEERAETLGEEVRWRQGQMEALEEEVEWRRGTMGELEREVERLRGEVRRFQEEKELRSRELAELSGVAEARLAELEWRRREMQDARERSRRGLVRLLARTVLLRQIAAWPPPEGGAKP